ncbi:hypothetical protein CB0940_07426 [Cercospora beticola]|uniref:Uncharacterized protein n=1 Tax=Cercospora beticola TaxID=122368 RepID=A0A2G5H7D1_CERBT|nr:hypothetical protein CB0940_07426 [Cercospora beticola]PIA88449.1 hypothetical protein CB0940_07426 [Cercospora beticola]WPB03374.1 hypothetical protein RHO25_008013 [Cercospora beticola]
MSSLEIYSITSPPTDIPLFEHVGDLRRCHFTTSPVEHFVLGKAPPTPVVPIAYQGQANARLSVTIQYTTPKTAAQRRLRCKIIGEGREISETISFETTNLPQQTLPPLQLKAPIVGGKDRGFPWKFGGTGRRSATARVEDDSGIELSSSTFEIEIYVLHANLPPYYTRDGIPLDLLRFNAFIPKWLSPQQDSDRDPDRPLDTDDWAACVIKALFRDRRLTYNASGGGGKYISEGSLMMELFLSDLTGLSYRPDDRTKYAVNCYDLARLAESIIPLGTGYGTVKPVFLEPYGWMKTTRLIGDRLETNNPFYTQPRWRKSDGTVRLICDQKDTEEGRRSAFANHMFLTIDKSGGTYALDSTCGPVTGEMRVIDYPNRCIAQDPYIHDIYKGTRSKQGTVMDIRTNTPVLSGLMPRVSQFAGAQTISDNNEKSRMKPLQAKMEEKFPPPRNARGGKNRLSIGTLQLPIISTMLLPSSAPMKKRPADVPCTSWTFQYDNGSLSEPVLVMIYVWTYPREKYSTVSTITPLKRFTDAWVDLRDRYGVHPMGQWDSAATSQDGLAVRLFADPLAWAITAIVSQSPSTEILQLVCNRVERALRVLRNDGTDIVLLKVPIKETLEKATIVLPPSAHVGEQFIMTVEASPLFI